MAIKFNTHTEVMQLPMLAAQVVYYGNITWDTTRSGIVINWEVKRLCFVAVVNRFIIIILVL